jgi:site-specific DNA recombinase
MKTVLYCRVSSKEQEETGYSLPAQEKLLLEYATRKGIEVIKVFSVAESASGIKKRKIFAEMIDFMKQNNIHCLLCEKVDRLTRNLKEAVVANDWVEENPERQLHFVKQNLVIHKNSKSDEKFRWDIEIVLAKKYIANLSEEVKKGQIEKIRSGWLPTKPPIGYKTTGDKGHKIHVVDESSASFIRKMFALYGSGNYSMNAVLEILYKEGFRTRAGGKLVKSRIESMLQDPFYYGAIRWNDALFGNGSQQPLISKELFDKVQKVRMGKSAPQYNRHEFQFRKMIACGECKGTITAEIQKGIVYYHCTHYKECSQTKYTPEKQLEEKLFGVFKFFENITPKEAEEIKLKIKQNHVQETEYKETTLKALNDRYSVLQKRIDNLYNDRLDQKITSDFWEKKNQEIIEEQNGLQDQIKKLKSEEAKYFEIWLNILDLARRAREIYEKRTPEQRRILLSHIFSNLVLIDDKVIPTLKKSVATLASRVQQKIDAKNTFEPKKRLAQKRQKDSFESLCPALLRG